MTLNLSQQQNTKNDRKTGKSRFSSGFIDLFESYSWLVGVKWS